MSMIGIVGGVGPYAGLDLARYIFNQTIAGTDQEHLPVNMISVPEKIADRTEYLLGNTENNPGYAVSEIILQLEKAGCNIVGIPCNTMHANKIFDVISKELQKEGSQVKLVNMVDEVINFLNYFYPDVKKMGVLSTAGAHEAGVYYKPLRNAGIKPILPSDEMQKQIHKAVYDSKFGIKAKSKTPSKRAKNILVNGIRRFKDQGAEGIILGCTEIAYTLPYKILQNIPLINATQILARSLIYYSYPEKLSSYSKY